jgi:hypothetical protein
MGMINMEIKNLKDTTNRIEFKLDKFIETADFKYATKEELCALRVENDKQGKEIEWTKAKIIDLGIKLANIIVILGLGTKVGGLW